jgi:hypothetical protein
MIVWSILRLYYGLDDKGKRGSIPEWGKIFISSLKHSEQPWGLPIHLFLGGIRIVHSRVSNSGTKLTAYPHLVPMGRMSNALTSFPLISS